MLVHGTSCLRWPKFSKLESLCKIVEADVLSFTLQIKRLGFDKVGVNCSAAQLA
jgi:hypothetical protein